MKESIGNSAVFTIIIIFVGIISTILIGSLSYTKAYKIRTRMINIIEKYKGYDNDNAKLKQEIDEYLKSAGYSVIKPTTNKKNVCPKYPDNNGVKAINTIDNYEYCIYRLNTVKGPYYHVTVFISFDIPVISSYLKFPISGETRIIYEL